MFSEGSADAVLFEVKDIPQVGPLQSGRINCYSEFSKLGNDFHLQALMSFRFRRTLGIIPGVRLNLSRSGPSVSLGRRGLHCTVGLRGTRTTVGFPGTGLSWTKYRSYSSGGKSRLGNRPHVTGPGSSPVFPEKIASNDPTAKVFESAPIERLGAGSTSELAPVLDAARKQWGYSPVVLAMAFLLVGLAVLSNSPPATVGAIVFGIIAWAATSLIDRKRRTVMLEYNLHDDELRKFNHMVEAFKRICNCERVWSVPLLVQQRDWKRNAGATQTIQAQKTTPRIRTPPLIKSNLTFPALQARKETIYFAPDAILVVAGSSVAALRYDEVEVDACSVKFIENDRAPRDTQVVGETWEFVNRKGGPDRRFANNRKLPVCLYGRLSLKSDSGLNEMFQFSQVDAAIQFASSVVAMRHSPTPDQPIENTIGQVVDLQKDEKPDPLIAFAGETEKARTLATEHGKFWEFLLMEELLKSRLETIKGEYEAFKKSLPYIPKKQFSGPDFIHWLADEFERLSSILNKMIKCVNEEMLASLGKPGVAGDPVDMLRAVDVLSDCCRSFLAFELEVSIAEPPSKLKVFSATLRGVALAIIGVVEQLANQWSEKVEALRNGSREFHINLAFPNLPQLNEALVEMGKVRQHPELYL